MTHIKSSDVPVDLFVGNILGAFALAIGDKMDNAVTSAVGQGTSYCYAIVQIGTEPNSSIEELRRTLGLEHSSVVRLIDKLQKAGLVERVRGLGSDRRQVCIRLTPDGEVKFTRILDARGEVLQNAIQNLNLSEIVTMGNLISKLMPSVVKPGDDQHVVCRSCELELCPQGSCPVKNAHGCDDIVRQVDFRRKVNSRFKEA